MLFLRIILATIGLAVASLAHAALPCALTKGDLVQITKAHATYEAQLRKLAKEARVAAHDEQLDKLTDIATAFEPLSAISVRATPRYCADAKATIDVFIHTIDLGKYTPSQRALYLSTLEALATKWGVTLSKQQAVIVAQAVTPEINRNFTEIDKCFERKNLVCVESVYNELSPLFRATVARTMHLEKRLELINTRFAVTQMIIANEQTPAILVDVRKLMSEKKYADAFARFNDALRLFPSNNGLTSAEMVLVRDELGEQWFASSLAEADRAVLDVKQSANDDTIRSAATTLANACEVARAFEIAHKRCPRTQDEK